MQLQPTVTVTEVHYKHTTSVYRVHADISTIFQDIPKPNSTVLVCWCDDVTEALHVLYLQLSAPLPLSLAPIKMANPDSPGKMTVKMERFWKYKFQGFFQESSNVFSWAFQQQITFACSSSQITITGKPTLSFLQPDALPAAIVKKQWRQIQQYQLMINRNITSEDQQTDEELVDEFVDDSWVWLCSASCVWQ